MFSLFKKKEKVKYNEIVLLVHPLHNVLYEFVEKYDNPENPLSPEELIIKLKKDKRFNVQIKKSLAAYGKKLLEYKDKPNAVLILIEILPTKPLRHTNEWIYKVMLDRFTKFGKKHLNERFIITANNPIFDEIDSRLKERIVPKSILKRLEPKISVSSFGEYADKTNCVRTWTSYLLSELRKKKISIDKVDIIKEISLFRSFESGPNLNDRLDFGHSRRVAQNKKKKAKLMQRKLRL